MLHLSLISRRLYRSAGYTSRKSPSACAILMSAMDSTTLSALQLVGHVSVDDAMQSFIKSHVLSNPITCETAKTKAPAEHKEERIKRPMNAFMVFSHQARKMIAKDNPNLKNSDLSKYLGATWKNFSEEKKAMFKRRAEELRAKHKKDHPQYKYQPRRKKCKSSSASNASHHQPADKPRPPPKTSIAPKKSAKSKGLSRQSNASISPASSSKDLFITDSTSPQSDQSSCNYGTPIQSFNHPLAQNYPYEYAGLYASASSNASSINTTNDRNNNVHCSDPTSSVRHSTHTSYGNSRATPSVLTPPTTPINADLLSLSLGNCVPVHLYAHHENFYPNGSHIGGVGHDYADDRLSAYGNYYNEPLLPSSSSHVTAVSAPAELDWYNGYAFGAPPTSDYISGDMSATEYPTGHHNGNALYDSQKFSIDPATYFEDEKKCDISCIDVTLSATNNYLPYNN